jgi:hypothetical protein
MQIRHKKAKNHLKIFLLETTWPISTRLCLNDPWVVPFQNCVCQRRPVSKMAAVTKNRNFFKWPMCPNLNCISIMMSFLTYITGFFMNFELLPIMQIRKKGG